MIPEFLKPENIKEENSKMKDVLEKYRKHFGTSVTTECSSLTDEEWIEVLEHCIEANEPYESDSNMDDEI